MFFRNMSNHAFSEHEKSILIAHMTLEHLFLHFRSLYDSVFTKLKSLLPNTVRPTLIICDYENALMGGLAVIFPTSQIIGCWFHYSQVMHFAFFFFFLFF